MTGICNEDGVMCEPKLWYLCKSVSSIRRPQWRLYTSENFRW